MSIALAPSPWPAPPRPVDDRGWRFARRVEVDAADGTRHAALAWVLRRNCSLTPRQVVAVYASLCAVSLSIAAGFWVHGAPFVAAFAAVELVGLGLALAVYARHATDRETVLFDGDRLTVERRVGPHVERADFRAAWLSVEPARAQGSLVELAGQGRRVRVGRFLRPDQRAAFAMELRSALRRARAGWPAHESERELQG
jgi:uncharacterized membrane protein